MLQIGDVFGTRSMTAGPKFGLFRHGGGRLSTKPSYVEATTKEDVSDHGGDHTPPPPTANEEGLTLNQMAVVEFELSDHSTASLLAQHKTCPSSGQFAFRQAC